MIATMFWKISIMRVVSFYGRLWLNAHPQPIAESERDEAGYLLLPSLRRAGAEDTMGHTAAEAD